MSEAQLPGVGLYNNKKEAVLKRAPIVSFTKAPLTSSIVPYSVLDNPAPNRYHTISEPTKKMSSVIGLGARRFQGYELGDVASPGPTDYRPEKPKRSLKI